MRKRSLCLAAAIGILTLSASALNAQMNASSGPKWMGGPFVGVNYTTVGGSGVTNPGYRAGVAAGGQLQADFSEGWFFRTGLLYSMRGATATESNVNITLKENYIEAPFLLGYGFKSTGSTMTPFVMAGGQVGFKISCDLEGKQSGTTASVKCDDTGSKFNSTDYAAVGGAGIMFPASSGTVSIDARYAYSFAKLSDSSDEVKHRGFTFGIAYMIPF